MKRAACEYSDALSRTLRGREYVNVMGRPASCRAMKDRHACRDVVYCMLIVVFAVVWMLLQYNAPDCTETD